MRFDLHTIWARTENAPDAPWLIDAWDEYTIDDNPSGWTEAIAKAAATTDEMRVVVISVEHEAILKAFDVVRVPGAVLGASEDAFES